MTAHGSDLADARQALRKGDLRVAQIDLRNAVRSDPDNAEAHYWLAKVSLDLGDPVAAEREVRAASERGFDSHQTVPLLAQTLLAQDKPKDLLNELKATGQDSMLDASVLVARGRAELAQGDIGAAQTSFALAERTAPDAVEPLLAEARLLGSRGDLNGAQAKIDRARAMQPEATEVLLDQAELARVKGDDGSAIKAFDRVIDDQPGNIRALLGRAQLEIAAGQPVNAKVDIDAVQRATPNNIQASYLQAVIQAQAKDFKSADATLDKINTNIDRIPRGYLLRAVVKQQLGQPAQAEAAARRYVDRVPNDLIGYKVLARLQLARHRADFAIETLVGTVPTEQGDPETYDLLGRAYAALGRSDDSINAFRKAGSLAPNDVGLQTRLASVRVGADQAELAMDDLERILRSSPTIPQISEALFFAALATGDLNKAAEALDKVRRAQGTTPVEENLEGLLKLAQLDQPGAAEKFREIVRKYPDFVPAQVNLSRVLTMQGQSAEAEQLLSSLLQRLPGAEPALTMLVSQYLQTDRMPAAIALLKKAHNADPGNAHLAAKLGDLYLRSGGPTEAVAIINNEKSAQDSVELLNLKAAAQLALNQQDQAQDTYSEILKLDPSALAARRKLEALLVKAGDYERARTVIKDGLVFSPRNYQHYLDYVMLDLKVSGIDAAIATARELQQQDLDFEAARALVGDVYMAANRPATAGQAYQYALSEAPSDMLLARLSAALLRTQQPEAALRKVSEWVQQRPDDVFALQLAADLCIAERQYAGVTQYLGRLLEKKPHDPVALNNLAWVYQQQGDNRATELAHEAYILAPSEQTADTLGWILVSAGNLDQGVPLLRQAIALRGSDPSVAYHYGVALNKLGQRDEAKRVLTAAIASQAEFDERAQAQQLLDELNKG
jgi:putative PEP-CTERM system TPR-repeat lipoprotein